MRPFAEAAGEQHLLFLPAAVTRHILLKLAPGEIELAQDGKEKAPVNPLPQGIVLHRSRKEGSILRDIGNDQAPTSGKHSGVRDLLAHQQPQDTRLAAAVRAGQRGAVSLLQEKAESLEERLSIAD